MQLRNINKVRTIVRRTFLGLKRYRLLPYRTFFEKVIGASRVNVRTRTDSDVEEKLGRHSTSAEQSGRKRKLDSLEFHIRTVLFTIS